MKTLATWFTPSLSVISRSKGSSSVASAAYRACQRLFDNLYQKVHDYTPKRGQIHTSIFGNFEGDIEALWNAAEASENRKNSTVAREIMIPLPDEWTEEQKIVYSDAVSKMLVKEYGVAGQFSLHAPNKKSKNYHVHVLFTTREVSNSEFGRKTRILDEGKKNGEVTNLRNRIADIMNKFAEKFGSNFFVTGGKFVEFDEDHIPTMNIPINATPEHRAELEEKNREIIEARGKLENVKGDIRKNEAEIQDAIISYEESKEKTRLKNRGISQSLVNLSQNVEKSLHASFQNVSPAFDGIENTIGEKNIYFSEEAIKPKIFEIYEPVLDENISREEKIEYSIEEPGDILTEAFRLQQIYRAKLKEREIYKINSSRIDKLKDELKVLENKKNSVFEIIITKLPNSVQNFLKVNDTIAERKELIKNLVADINKLKSRQVEIKTLMYSPEVLKDCEIWESNLAYRKAIEEFERQSPDYKKPSEYINKMEPIFKTDLNAVSENLKNTAHPDCPENIYGINNLRDDAPKPPGYD